MFDLCVSIPLTYYVQQWSCTDEIHLLIIGLLHFQSRSVLCEGLGPLHSDLPSGGILPSNGVYLGISAAHTVDSGLPLPNEVLPFAV